MRSDFRKSFDEIGYGITQAGSGTFEALVDQAYARSIELARMPPPKMERKWTHVSGKVKHLVNPHRTEEAFRRLLQSEEINRLVAEIFPGTPVFVGHSKISFKVSGIEQIWAPHQDSGYMMGSKIQGATFAVYLEDCSKENGTLELFPKSQLLGRLKHEIILVENESEPQIRVTGLPLIDPVPVEGEKGSVLGMSFNMIHQSGHNKKGGFRCIYIFDAMPFDTFPLEADGADALILNAGADGIPRPLLLPLRKSMRRILDKAVKPLAKKVIAAYFQLFAKRKTAAEI